MRSDGNHTGHLTPEIIREYLGGKLDSAAMHRIEAHLLDCEFCSDAVEGFELSGRSHVRTEQALLILRRKLNQKVREHDRPRMLRWPAWSAAAGIALAIAGYVVIKQQESEQKLQAIRQSEAFLQTGVNDTLVIFLPNEYDPVGSERLLASNTSNTSNTSAGTRQTATLRDSQPLAAASQAPAASTEAPVTQTAAAKQAATAQAHAKQTAGAKAYAKQATVPAAEARAKQVAAAAKPASVTVHTDSTQTGDTVFVVAFGSQKRSSIVGSIVTQSERRTISGRVVDSKNSSLPGVSVRVPGTSLGTATDAQGNFTLDIPDETRSLVVSMLGYEADTVPVSEGADHLLLAMQPAQQDLDEIVVVGYSQKGGQVPPAPSIGKEAYEKYLSDSLRYPEEALRMEIEGEVLVGFTVRGSGRPAAFKVVRSLGYGCDQEAIRLIREGPEWVSPVSKRGRRHPAEAVQAVKFQLSEEDK